MPGMDGHDLILAVHARRPALPAILLTGHVEEIAADPQAPAPFRLLQKPVTPAKIAAQLAAMMRTEAE